MPRNGLQIEDVTADTLASYTATTQSHTPSSADDPGITHLHHTAKMIEAGLKEGAGSAEIAGRIAPHLQAYDQAANANATASSPTDPDDLFDSFMREYERDHERVCVGEPLGAFSGLPTLDQGGLGAFRPGFHAIGAEPGAGKTAFALNAALTTARKGIPVLFVTFEQTPTELKQRLVCRAGGIDGFKVQKCQADPRELRAAWADHAPDIRCIRFLHGGSDTTPADIERAAAALMQEYGTHRGLIVLDYLQKMASMIMTQTGDGALRKKVGKLAGELRLIGKERLGVPVLCICATNREGQRASTKNKETGFTMQDFKESGEIEYACDSAYGLVSHPDGYDPMQGTRQVHLYRPKNRVGSLIVGEPLHLTFYQKTGAQLEPYNR